MARKKKVNIESLTYTDKNYWQHSIQFYLTRQEVLDNKEMSIIYSEVCIYFRNNYSCKLSLEQLRQIKTDYITMKTKKRPTQPIRELAEKRIREQGRDDYDSDTSDLVSAFTWLGNRRWF